MYFGDAFPQESRTGQGLHAQDIPLHALQDGRSSASGLRLFSASVLPWKGGPEKEDLTPDAPLSKKEWTLVDVS